jgi:hypothetical protein
MPPGEKEFMQIRKTRVGAMSMIIVFRAVHGLGGDTVHATESNVRYSSVYTAIPKDCKSSGTESDMGSYTPLICRGSASYKLSITFGRLEAYLSAENGETSIPLGDVNRGWNLDPGRKLEWRRFDGKPFAVIYRVSVYTDTQKYIDTGKTLVPEENRVGSRLIVVGLKGFASLTGEFDGKDPKANANARALADAAYSKR